MSQYTQQQIVNLYKKLIPSITEADGKIKISLRGVEFSIEQGRRSPSQKTSTRNIGYR